MGQRRAVSEYSDFFHRKFVAECETLQVDENRYVRHDCGSKTDVPVCLIYKFSYESAHNVVQRVIFNHSIMYNETIGGSVDKYIFFTVKFNSHIDGGALDGIVLSRTIYYYEWTITHKIIDIQMRIIASVISFAEKRAYMLYNIVYRILLKSKYI